MCGNVENEPAFKTRRASVIAPPLYWRPTGVYDTMITRKGPRLHSHPRLAQDAAKKTPPIPGKTFQVSPKTATTQENAMKTTATRKSGNRVQPRWGTHAGITCRPFTSGFLQTAEGIMRNFSTTGSYIETSCEFKPGTVLIIRLTLFPSDPSSPAKGAIRSIALAEVKWLRELSNKGSAHYGMGVRYLR